MLQTLSKVHGEKTAARAVCPMELSGVIVVSSLGKQAKTQKPRDREGFLPGSAAF